MRILAVQLKMNGHYQIVGVLIESRFDGANFTIAT